MDLVVAADDRTGAYETAAAIADVEGRPVPVSVWTGAGTEPCRVVDLGSRHLSPNDARRRAAAVEVSGRAAHKFDSTLRGNWAEELAGRHAVRGRPVLVVAALPGLGRTCVGGVVFDHGRPVHEGSAGSDVRRRVTTSRPAEMLHAAGCASVVEVDHAGDWLKAPSGIAVTDATTEADIDAIAEQWSTATDVLLAGTSAVIGAAAGALLDGAPVRIEPEPLRPGVVLIVCGSVHPVARAQIADAECHGTVVTPIADDITARVLAHDRRLILVSEIPVGEVEAPMAIAASVSLARGASELLAACDVTTLVVIGGDTATAVIGPRRAEVLGNDEPGTARVRVDGIEAAVLTRSGGFGADDALSRLLARLVSR